MGHILQLDGLRFIMCCIIFGGHCFSNFLKDYSYGWMKTLFFSSFAVDYFFMLSGFGIYLNALYKEGLVKKIGVISSVKYAVRRIKKCYPTYVFSLLLYAPFYLFTKWYIPFFIMCLTLVQSMAYPISHAINAVGWFLSALFLSYICCPTLYKIIRCCNIYALFSITFLAIVGLQYIENVELISFRIYGINITIGEACFGCLRVFLGMLLAKLYCQVKELYNPYIYIYIWIITIICFFWQISRYMLFDMFGVAPILTLIDVLLCGCFILLLSLDSNCLIISFLRNKHLLLLGKYSMYIYLLHWPAIFVCHKIFTHYGVCYGNLTGLFELICVVFMTIVFIHIALFLESILNRFSQNKTAF